MKKAVAYLRVSTDGQVDGYGLEAQLHDVTEYAKAHNIEIVEVFREEGVSGAKDSEERVALVMMLDYIEAHPEIECVIIPRLDRLARMLEIQEKIISDLRSRGLKLISVKEPDLDSDDSVRNLVRRLLGLINEFEREVIAARMKAGRMAKARKGEHAAGRIPFGYKSINQDGKKVLVKDEEEAEIVRIIFELRDQQGKTFRHIADYLNSKGYTTKSGAKFYHSTIRQIYYNPKYKGIIRYNEGGNVIVTENENYRVV